jgi:hypothetical protein
MAEAPPNPYVGPRPYERGDASRFFGRDVEVRRLLSLVIAHRVVLLYAASGAGKSSLLNAGLIPLLEEEEDFEVLPVARIGGPSGSSPLGGGENVFAKGLLSSWEPSQGDVAARSDAALADYLIDRPRSIGEDGFRAARAIVVDQFEELFTLHPDRWAEREGLFRQLALALERDQPLRVLLSIREEYIALLDPYGHLVPEGLSNRFRLERLGPEQALGAVTGPLVGTQRSFTPEAAASLVSDLLKTRIEVPAGGVKEIRGEYVEPVQLQVTCHSLWEELPDDVDEIHEQHLLTFGDVDDVLARFYDEAIGAAATAAGVGQFALRDRFERAFITRTGTRSTVTSDMATTAGIPELAVGELERRHLIRAEMRAGARWYELTHDRFIQPVCASNRRTSDARRRRRLRAVAGGGACLAVSAAAAALALSQPSPRARLETIQVTMSFSFDQPTRKSTVLRALQLTSIPRGSSLLVSCRPPRGGGRCPAPTVTRRNVSGTLTLRSYTQVFPAGTVIEARVTKPNTVGAVKLLRIGVAERPALATRCLPPGGSRPERC